MHYYYYCINSLGKPRGKSRPLVSTKFPRVPQEGGWSRGASRYVEGWGDFKVSKFQRFKDSKFPSFKVSEFQSFKVPKFE